MRDHANPFRPGPGQDPPYLSGRDAELDGFTRMLHRTGRGKARNMLVHGLRGVGKTALLNRFSRACADEGFLPIVKRQYSSRFSKDYTFVVMLQYDLDMASESLPKGDKTTMGINYIKSMERALEGASRVPSCLSMHDHEDGDVAENQIYGCLARAWKAVKENGFRGALLLMDDFHTVRDSKAGCQYVLTDLVGALNALQADGYRYSLVLCGLPTLASNIGSTHPYTGRMFTSVQLSNLDEGAAAEAILRPAAEARMSFSDGTVSAILRDTDRYPYLIQFFCRELIRMAGKGRIVLGDYMAAKNGIIKRLGTDFFGPLLEPLNDIQRDVLYAMASVRKEDVDLASVAAAAGMSKISAYNRLRGLEGRDLVFQARRGVYRFTIPLFAKYLPNGPVRW